MTKNLNDIYVGVNSQDKKRRKNDFYGTPPLVTHILCKYSDVPRTIVEPCSGRGNISVELKRQNRDVKSFDLYKYDHELIDDIQNDQDVLTLPKQDCEGLVTNPPYFKSLPQKILQKSLKEYDYTAMFVRLTFLEGMRRYSIFKEHAPSQIIFFSDRVRFSEKKTEAVDIEDQIGGMIAYMWIIFDKNKTGTKLDWILMKDEYNEWRELYDKRTNT